MGYDFSGEIVARQTEPLTTWKVYYWTPRATKNPDYENRSNRSQ